MVKIVINNAVKTAALSNKIDSDCRPCPRSARVFLLS